MTLVRIPSIEEAPAPHAPFCIPCRKALDKAVALFEREGLDCTVYGDGVYGLAKKAGKKAEIGLFTHLDVVPVTNDWMLNLPFDPQIHDGCLVGRGVHDNKAGATMALYALHTIKALGLPLHSAVTVFLGTNEETGMGDIHAYAEEQPMPTVSLVPDNAYPVCLGEKGIYHLWAKSNQPLCDILSIDGGVATNVILDNVTAKVKPSDNLFNELVTAIGSQKEYKLEVRDSLIYLTAYGITAHGSAPASSLNAGKLLLKVLLDCPSLSAQDKQILSGAYHFLSADYGEPFGIDAEDPYFGKTTATNGMFSTKDGILSLSFDIRYGASSAPDWVEACVRTSISEHGFTPYREENRPGFRIPEDEPTAQALIEAYRTVSGDHTSKVIYSGGGTYARHLKNAFSCGCEAPYLTHDLGLPQGHGHIHQSDESIAIEALLESIKLLTVMLLSLDEACQNQA